jgi:hypothetical protein
VATNDDAKANWAAAVQRHEEAEAEKRAQKQAAAEMEAAVIKQAELDQLQREQRLGSLLGPTIKQFLRVMEAHRNPGIIELHEHTARISKVCYTSGGWDHEFTFQCDQTKRKRGWVLPGFRSTGILEGDFPAGGGTDYYITVDGRVRYGDRSWFSTDHGGRKPCYSNFLDEEDEAFLTVEWVTDQCVKLLLEYEIPLTELEQI